MRVRGVTQRYRFVWMTAALLGCEGCGGRNDRVEKTGWTKAPVVVCAGPDTQRGVDVSEYQGSIDWARVKSSGYAFAIARVSDGTGHPDPTFDANWSGIKAAGMVRGAYQFFRASDDPIAQANLFVDALGTLDQGDLPPVADVEIADGVSAATLVSHLSAWTERVRAATGRAPMIYTTPSFWNALPDASGFESDTLWVANWQVTCPDIPSSWQGWTFWQYEDNGVVPGISGNVDLDELNGSLSPCTSP